MIAGLDLKPGFEIVIQGQSLADVGYRHLVAGRMLNLGGSRIGDGNRQLIATLGNPDTDRSAFGGRLDTVIDRIFEQGLEHQRRNRQTHENRADLPVDRETVAEPQMFQLKILFAERDFIGQTDQFAGVAHRRAEQVGKRLQRGFGLLRPGSDQRQHGIQ